MVRRLVGRWRYLALKPDVIAPQGSNRSNHRQDQAILTLLLIEAAQCNDIQLTQDEIDVGSSCPIPWLSAQNKVANSIPIVFDPFVRLLYRCHKWKRRREHRARQDRESRSSP